MIVAPCMKHVAMLICASVVWCCLWMSVIPLLVLLLRDSEGKVWFTVSVCISEITSFCSCQPCLHICQMLNIWISFTLQGATFTPSKSHLGVVQQHSLGHVVGNTRIWNPISVAGSISTRLPCDFPFISLYSSSINKSPVPSLRSAARNAGCARRVKWTRLRATPPWSSGPIQPSSAMTAMTDTPLTGTTFPCVASSYVNRILIAFPHQNPGLVQDLLISGDHLRESRLGYGMTIFSTHSYQLSKAAVRADRPSPRF